MNTTVQNAASLSAARRLSIDVANLSFRLAVAEAAHEEIRSLLFYEVEGGSYMKAIDPDQWHRRTAAVPGAAQMPGVVEVDQAMTAERAEAVAEAFRNRTVRSEIVLTEDQADAIVRLVSALEQLLL